jgi:tetratricopeptide (TPR) repeat protein
MMKQVLLIYGFIGCLISMSFGQTISLSVPNALYSEGKYEDAFNAYQQLVQQGNISDVLYFNLANAAFKTGRYADAVLNYKKALRVNPKHTDARFNLKVTQQMLIDKKANLTEVGLSKILHKIRYALNMDGWAVLQIIFLFFCFISFVAVYLVSHIKIKKALFLLSFLWVIPAAISLGFAQWQYAEIHAPEAVIMSSSVNVMSEPNENSTVLFILHGGSSAEVLQNNEGWLKISFDEEKIGWIESKHAALVQIP